MSGRSIKSLLFAALAICSVASLWALVCKPTNERLIFFKLQRGQLAEADQANASNIERRYFPFLFVHSRSEELKLNIPVNLPSQEAWLFHGRAKGHGQIEARQNGHLIAKANVLETLPPGIEWGFSRLGTTESKGTLELRVFSEDGKPFTSELSGVLFSAKGSSLPQMKAELTEIRSNQGREFAALNLLGFVIAVVLQLLTKVNTPERKISQSALVLSLLVAASWQISLMFAFPLSGMEFKEFPVERVVDGTTEAYPLLSYASFSEADSSEEISSRVLVAESKTPWPEVQANIFGGYYAEVNAFARARTFHILGSLVFAAVVLSILSTRRELFPLTLVLSWAANVLLSLRLGEGYDELYINLRHSLNLMQHGRYSFNLSSHGEATVDFLPLVLTGIFGAVSGVDLTDIAVGLSLLGNLLCLVAIYFLAFRFTEDRRVANIIMLVCALFPPLFHVGGSGFFATLFTAHIFAVAYFTFFTERRILGLFLCGLLPLVRIEGVVLGGLVFMVFAALEFKQLRNKKPSSSSFRDLVRIGLILFSPFVALSLFRVFYFGHFLPTPVTFKNTNFHEMFLRWGVISFENAFKRYRLKFLLGIAGIAFLLQMQRRSTGLGLLFLVVLLLAFVLPYQIGGGDWFPWYWNRYLLPWILCVVFVALTLSSRAIARRTQLPGWANAAFVGLFACSFGLYEFNEKNLSGPCGNAWQYSLFSAGESQNRWGRIDELSQLGHLFDATTPVSTRISSSEVATMMYFGNREIHDLLGVANEEIARAPLAPAFDGALVFRKRNPCLIDRDLPEIIALNDPAASYSPPGPIEVAEVVGLLNSRFFDSVKNQMAHYRVGTYKRLERLGYHNLTVAFRNHLFNYFVHDSILQFHLEKLAKLGVSEKTRTRISIADQTAAEKNLPTTCGTIPKLRGDRV